MATRVTNRSNQGAEKGALRQEEVHKGSIASAFRKAAIATALAGTISFAPISTAYAGTRSTSISVLKDNTNVLKYQQSLTFGSDNRSLSVTFNAASQDKALANGVNQMDSSYLLNGLTNNGTWFQIGVTNTVLKGLSSNLEFTVEVFNKSGASIYPSNNTTGSTTAGNIKFTTNTSWIGRAGTYGMSADGFVRVGDRIRLFENVSNGSVSIGAVDLSNGKEAIVKAQEGGARFFVGLDQTANREGFFSGVMTETDAIKSQLRTRSFAPVRYALHGKYDPSTMTIYISNATSSNSTEAPAYNVSPAVPGMWIGLAGLYVKFSGSTFTTS